MNTPRRSAAISRALASETDGLPEDFAARVAAIAEARATARAAAWNTVAMLASFAAMIGVCLAGWARFGEPELGSMEWLDPWIGAAASEPWLAVGLAGVALVQVLTFRRRALT
jgi:hypothetical protein